MVIKKRGSIKSKTLKYKLDDSEVLVEAVYSGISYGTEKIVFDGLVPKNQYDLMRAPHQEGSFNTSVKYGYLNVGKVIKGPRKY